MILLLSTNVVLNAQKNSKNNSKNTPSFDKAVLVPEEIKRKCADIPFENRIKVRVAKFSRSTSGTEGVDINNFSTMLSNALFEVDCYRVMAMQKDTTDSGSDIETETEKPQIVATGEITEYSHTTNTTTALATKKTKYIAKLGFVLQIKNPVTQEILFSKSFNKEGLAESNSVSVNVRVPGFGNQNVGSTSEQPVQSAYFDAIEKGILDAVTYLIDNQAKIKELLKGTAGSNNKTSILVSNATYPKLLEIEQAIKTAPGVQKVDKTFASGIGKMTIIHAGSMDELVNVIVTKLGTVVDVTGMEESKITLQVK
jgi:curli biogenesis system outer membrane secretion channel CsgG